MRWLMVVALSLLGTAAGCYVEPNRERVVVDQDHRCTDRCTHYYHSGHWYVAEGHRHGPGCGHVLRGGVWIVE